MVIAVHPAHLGEQEHWCCWADPAWPHLTQLLLHLVDPSFYFQIYSFPWSLVRRGQLERGHHEKQAGDLEVVKDLCGGTV